MSDQSHETGNGLGAFLKKQITRREFIKMSAAGSAAAIIASLFPEIILAPTIADIYKDYQANRRLATLLQQQGVSVEGIGLGIKNVPLKWTDANRHKGIFSVDVLVDAHQKAAEAKESKLALIQRVEVDPNPIEEPKKTKEKPVITELPKDVVSEEELKQKGIEIIGTGEIEMRFRRGIFEPGGLLDDYSIGTDRKQAIFISNRPVLSASAFRASVFSRHQELITRVFSGDQEIQEIRNRVIKRIQESARRGDDVSNRVKLIGAISDDEIEAWGLRPGTTDGYFLPAGADKGLADTSVIFLALGDRPRFINYLSVTAFPQEDVYKTDLLEMDLEDEFGLTRVTGILSSQTYPSPDEFEILKEYANLARKLSPAINPKDRTPGSKTRHELVHNKRINHPTNPFQNS